MMRVLAWFSCGAASAVAAKLAVKKYGDACEVCYCDTSLDEHKDNARFRRDVSAWIGKDIKVLGGKYKTVDECCTANRYLVGVAGAPCTKHMKRSVREAYQKPDDVHVFGFTADEATRCDDFNERWPSLATDWILRDQNIHKGDCYKILQAVGIELPAMYKLGFNNNNCIGCVKGGAGYWNKIRDHFPEKFAERARLERTIGATVLRVNGKRIYLDELPQDAGRDVAEPDIECGVMCDSFAELIK